MVGILLISTRLYKKFVPPLLSQIDELFLPDYPKTIFLFTDEVQRGLPHLKNEVRQIIIPSYGWPYATLFRYRCFADNANQLSGCSHLVYMDIDMEIVKEISYDEFLPDEGLTIVRHPGFYVSDFWGNGDNENPKSSTSYMPPENRKHYYCGGVQAGTSEAYLLLSKTLSKNIDIDQENKVMSIYHDETHYNKYVNENFGKIPMKELTPQFCMVEEPARRKLWGIDNLPVSIIALSKDHKTIRE